MPIELVYEYGWVAAPTLSGAGDGGGAVDWDGLLDRLRPSTGRRRASADPLDQVAADLRSVDRAMARVLRAIQQATPRDGLSVRRQVSLLAGATGYDVAFLDRAVQTLTAMPQTWQAFDRQQLSWSQLRGIVCEARRLTVTQRGVLDQALTGLLAAGTGEPDRIVEQAGDITARLDALGQDRLEQAQERGQRVSMQLDFDGWADLHGLLGPELAATVASALDAAADAPVADDHRATDDDGRVLPQTAQPPRTRAGQWAEGLRRLCTTYLSGGAADEDDHDNSGGGERAARSDGRDAEPTGADDGDPTGARAAATGQPGGDRAGRSDSGPRSPRPARPTVIVVAPLSDLLGDDVDLGVSSITSRLLLRRGSGRRRITRALTRTLADDTDIIALFTDNDGIPIAIGDRYSPITAAMRHAVIARDQGCRAPGCTAPAEHCDIHHVIPRERGGLTEVANLVLHCRPCHTAVRRHHWTQRLDPDGTLHTRIGRRTYITRPRLDWLPDLRPPPVDTARTDSARPGRAHPDDPASTAPPLQTAEDRQPRSPDQPLPF
ncbi:hypothetical protein BH23ACT9_BH23ACT9_36950 [soil metagenome]